MSRFRMNRRSSRNPNIPWRAPVLVSEAAEEFEALRADLEDEIKPRGIIERLYVDDFATIIWEARRLQRCKVAILNRAFRGALEDLICQLLTKPDPGSKFKLEPINGPTSEELEPRRQAHALAEGWFADAKGKTSVMSLLQASNYSLDDVEGLAFKAASEQIELIDRMVTLLELRRNKTLACVAEYRGNLAQQLSQTSEKVIQKNPVFRFERASKKTKAV